MVNHEKWREELEMSFRSHEKTTKRKEGLLSNRTKENLKNVSP